MGTKRDKGLLIGLADLLALLPWWAGVVAAVVSYLVLHALAAPEPAHPIDPPHLGDFAVHTIWKSLAYIGQFLIPLACLAGSAASAYRRKVRRQLVRGVAAGYDASALNNMTWQEFEQAVGEAFRLDGFQVEERGGAAADGGIDLVLHRGGGKYLVQCKQWRAQSVSVGVVRELYGVMTMERAVGGFVVTSGGYTLDAIGFARGKAIVLVDGPMLFDMIKRGKRAPSENARPAAVPNCPLCGKPMVERVAKTGPTAGTLFWGCSTYPVCKGTRDK